jgi:hypothetical protein
MPRPRFRLAQLLVPAPLAALGLIALAGCVPAPVPDPSTGPSLTPPAVTTGPPTATDTLPPPTSTASVRPSVDPPPPPRPPRPSPTTAAAPPTRAQLQAALLTTADLAGFRYGHDAATSVQGGCPALDTGLDPGARVTVQVLLEKTGNGPYVRERLILYSGHSAAGTAVASVRGAPSACPTFVVTDPVVGKLEYTVTPLSVQRYGDETAAVRLTAVSERYPSIRSYENLVVIRRGAVVILVAHTSVTTIDNSLTSAAVSTAYARASRGW